MTRYRRPIREVQVNRRHGALSAKERRRMKVYLLIAAWLLAGAERGRRKEDKHALRTQAALLCVLVCDMRIDRVELPLSVRADPPSFANVSDTDAWTDYRCRKSDLQRLLNSLRLPARWVCKNGSNYPGEAALLLVIYRLREGFVVLDCRCERYPNRLTDLQQRFGRDYTQLSRIFNEVVDWLWEKHRHRLMDNLGFDEPQFAEMARKIEQRGAGALKGSSIVGFIDGTLRRNCRPGGPREFQQEVFDGHHRAHGLAYQSVVFPNGMIGDLYGPAVGRRHDGFLLEKSKLYSRLAHVQQNNDVQYRVYGDAAYPLMSHMDRGYIGANLTATQKIYNREMSRVRVSVEWMFGKIVAEYSFVDFRKNLKIRKQAIAKYYVVAALLTNAHTCLYGSITGLYFGMASPSVEEYFASWI